MVTGSSRGYGHRCPVILLRLASSFGGSILSRAARDDDCERLHAIFHVYDHVGSTSGANDVRPGTGPHGHLLGHPEFVPSRDDARSVDDDYREGWLVRERLTSVGLDGDGTTNRTRRSARAGVDECHLLSRQNHRVGRETRLEDNDGVLTEWQERNAIVGTDRYSLLGPSATLVVGPDGDGDARGAVNRITYA